jgi:hypothetical protein
MTDRQVDERLAWLCHVEDEGEVESVEAAVADLPREELERLLEVQRRTKAIGRISGEKSSSLSSRRS